MTDPPRLSELPEGDPARSLFGSLRDMAPPADLHARTLAGLGLVPPPAAPPPPSPPAPLAPSGASLLSATALKPLATGIALLSLAGAAAHVALGPPRPAAPRAPAAAAPVAASVAPPLLASPVLSVAAPEATAPSSDVTPLGAATPPPVLAMTPPLERLPAPGRLPSPARREPVAEGLAGTSPVEVSRAPTLPSAAEPPAPVVAPAVSSRPRLDLDRELASLDLARRALSSGAPARALEALASYRVAFPAGQLGVEALLLEIEARVRMGERATAVHLAETFLERHPRSVLAPRVRSLAGLPPGPMTNP